MLGTYKLISDIWHNSILRYAGETIELALEEAKYLAHALEEVVVHEIETVAKDVAKVTKDKVETLKTEAASKDGA